MKRCPKCNRSFPDENQKFCTIDGGLLVSAEQPFDPNATVHSSSPRPDSEAGRRNAGPQHDWSETIAINDDVEAPTAVLPRQTGPTGAPTAGNLRPPAAAAAAPPAAVPEPTPAAAHPADAPGAHTPSSPPTPVAPTPSTAVAQAPATPKVQSVPPVVKPAAGAQAIAGAPPVQKKSRLPLILGMLALLLVFGVAALAAGVYFFVIKPRRETVAAAPPVVTRTESENSNTNTAPTPEAAPPVAEQAPPAFVAPPNTTQFVNSAANLDGKLAEHYLDFSFYYPDNWVADAKAGKAGANNFAKFERRLPDIWQESFAVGWYSSKGTFAADEAVFPQLAEQLGAAFAKSFPGYRKTFEGPTKVNSLDGYEFRFESSSPDSQNGDLQLWGRVIFLPTGTAGENGATLVMLATSRAPELSSPDDLGVRGQMPVILESFRFGKAD